MTILRDTYGNKIQRNASGEVLYKSDALIDLRSTFGVTKDGSNNVSKVKLLNSPSQVFRDNGSNCIENGDGFDFASNSGLGRLETNSFPNFTGDFFIGWWGKHKNSVVSGNRAIFGCYASGSPSVYAYITNASTQIVLSLNGTATIVESNAAQPDLLNWNYFSIERVGGTVYFCKNGLRSGSSINSTTFTTNENKIHLANLGGVNSFSVNDFKIDNFQIFAKSLNDYTGTTTLDQVFTPPKRSSE